MRLGILSDIHEDITSLTKALVILERERVDQVVSLGDIMGFDNGYYGSSPVQDAEGCIRLVKENCSLSVAGNHDLFAIRKLPLYPAGFTYPPEWYSKPLEDRRRIGNGRFWDYSHAEEEVLLSDAAREYLSGLPEFAILESDGIRIMLSHHLYPDLSGSMRKMPTWAADIWSHLNWMKRHACNVGVSGHVHIEGTLVGTWYHMKNTPLDRFSLNGSRTWLSCRPVTTGGVSSGLTIIDTASGLVKTRSLETSDLS